MNKLIIHTKYHVTVELLLMQFEMVERHHHIEVIDGGIAIDHPDDCMSQDLVFWLAMAQGCGLVESYLFGRSLSSRDKQEDLAQKILFLIDQASKEKKEDELLLSRPRLRTLIDDIEDTCKQAIKKEVKHS